MIHRLNMICLMVLCVLPLRAVWTAGTKADVVVENISEILEVAPVRHPQKLQKSLRTLG
ncbi:MAG: hypothetical protein WBC93_16950 [Sulfitobacter sp.]